MEAFPKTIEATELNQGTNNEIIKTTVSFSFRYWLSLPDDDKPVKRAFTKAQEDELKRTNEENKQKYKDILRSHEGFIM